MKAASVSKIKATLSEYLASVKAGQEVMITERGRPIAKIIPLSSHEKGDAPHLLQLERAGLAKVGAGRLPRKFWNLPRPADPHGQALKSLIEERRSDR